jgi:hypothetical protein
LTVRTSGGPSANGPRSWPTTDASPTPSTRSVDSAIDRGCTRRRRNCWTLRVGSGGYGSEPITAVAILGQHQLLIALACPDATYVCGFRSWLELGYQVRKGEKAIRVLALMTINADATGKSADGKDEERRVFFRAVPVFDTQQIREQPSG